MDTEAEELAAMRRTRERLADPPFRPVGDWAASRALMVAAYDRAIERALSDRGETGRVEVSGKGPPATPRSLSALTEPGAAVAQVVARGGSDAEAAGSIPVRGPGSVSARQEATR